MESVALLEGTVAPLPIANIDTDRIIPAAYLKTVSRAGLGKHLFAGMRIDPEFILNRRPWDEAKILIALENFGCGSSREHAVWALLDFGINCVIAPTFADIFRNNCRKNGLLTICISPAVTSELIAIVSDPATTQLVVDLRTQTIGLPDGRRKSFDIEEQERRDLLAGADEIRRTLALADKVEAFEQRRVRSHPWQRLPPDQPGDPE